MTYLPLADRRFARFYDFQRRVTEKFRPRESDKEWFEAAFMKVTIHLVSFVAIFGFAVWLLTTFIVPQAHYPPTPNGTWVHP